MNTLVMDSVDGENVVVDIFQKLANNRIIFITGEIEEQQASDVVASLILKDSEDCSKPITIFINSYGGDIRSCFAIYDAIKVIESPVKTICFGIAEMGAALLLSAGTEGMRYATQHSIVVLSQLLSDEVGFGSLEDAKSKLEQQKLDSDNFINAIAKNVGKTSKSLSKILEKTQYWDAQQALEIGLVDNIISGVKNA